MSLPLRAVVVLLLAALTPGPASAVPPPSPPGVPDQELVKPDPRAIFGVLDNGLRYGVMRRTGVHDMTLLLYIKAGSADEAENERGVAHFLEHMAFDSSRAFPGNSTFRSFGDVGVSLQPDKSARTDFRSTTFELNLSQITPAKIDLGLRWLRDAADGLTLAQADVDQERETIRSEYRASQNAGGLVQHEVIDFLGRGLLGPSRDPIGADKTIASIDARTLRSFYQKWYRPERAVVILVGDAPAESLKASVEAAFGSWKDAAPAAPEPELGGVAPRGLDVLVVSDPRATNTVNVCRATDKDPVEPEDVNTHQREIADVTWSSVLRHRLALLSQSANPPFISAKVTMEYAFDRANFACVNVSMRDQNWRDTVRNVAIETRRMERFGITDTELSRTKLQYGAALDHTVAALPTASSRGLAQVMLLVMSSARVFDTGEEDRRVGRMAMDRISKATIDTRFRHVWTEGAGPLIVILSSASPTSAEVKAAWTDTAGTPLSTPVD